LSGFVRGRHRVSLLLVLILDRQLASKVSGEDFASTARHLDCGAFYFPGKLLVV
jgi:hypothetical protein